MQTDLLPNLSQKIAKITTVDAIYLFGSRARGDNDSRSDIDLAINCPKADNKQWSEILDLIETAPSLLYINAVRLDKLNPTSKFFKNIQEDKIILYETKPKR